METDQRENAVPVANMPGLGDLASAALALLAVSGAPVERAGNRARAGWQALLPSPDGVVHEVSLSGPDIPSRLPETVAPDVLIPAERPFEPVYRLAVRAPLLVLDVAWSPDRPIRIMTFSRGDWEDVLLSAGQFPKISR